ncbi:subtilase family serine protease [Granulicella aggregans]|uniref:Subtilase family serine protease n=1 Tax=Granulicella aggregans TaxID=474949 RepID=A0A7W7ZD11_9BACT|nr:protease pro-enzyme activation domain-containing protein [Granulicella aggregans]MBB5057608.1 subtilase family serine protease [Granulicella aggregans]
MLKFLFRRLLPALASLSVIVPGAQAAVQNRISSVSASQTVALAQSISPRLKSGQGMIDLGEADGTKALSTMTLRFTMTTAQKAALIQLLEDQQNPASSKYHQWLTPEQFASKFGMSSSDLATVSQWLTGQGFKVESIARGGTFIQFSGTVARAQTAFRTSIHRVSVNGEEHIANVTAVSLPAGIAGVVGSVAGLDDFKLKPHSRVRQVQANANPKFTSSTSGNIYIAPGDFYTIYDVKPLLTSSINGTGITIAIAGQTDIALSDIAAFRSAAGLTANVPTVKLYGTDPGTPSSDDLGEADLDIEWSGAVAPSSSILYVNTGASSGGVINSLTQIIDNNLAPIASISYGLCEAGEGGAEANSLNTLFQQANAQGITIVSAAGDSGATDCDDVAPVTSATHGLAVDFPGSSPYVTSLGGTMFNEGAGTYFGSSNDANGGSAISYIPEAVWNETAEDIVGNSPRFGAGGGGASSFFAKPSWQTGTGVPSDFARDVPDISLNSAANHDGYLMCTQGSCVNGFRTSSGNLTIVGGTSVAAPSFAGILALVQQKIGAATGNANPVIYALANSTYYNTVFHDVTVGNNASPCTAGSTNCPSGGNIGYSANVGYDLATGWGSVDAYNLANTWTLVMPVTTGTTGTQVSTTTATVSPTSVTAGTPVTVTATVANGGTANSTAPTGTVQFLVDNVATGGAVTLASGAATLSLSTTALSSGAHVISAAYSGDALYASSKGSATLDVTSASTADFTLTPATTTVTVKAGADGSGVLYTVTPVNGFTGSVTFSAGTSDNLSATYSFSPLTETISSTTPVTTTLILSAYSANARTGSGRLRLKPVESASLEKSAPPIGRTWYAGSGAAVACVLLLMVPKRRRWTGLFAAVLALGAVSMMTGCGDNSSSTTGVTNSSAGTYTVVVTATGTSSAGATVSHTSTVTFVVQ